MIRYTCQLPTYTLWPYEEVLARREIRILTGGNVRRRNGHFDVTTARPVPPDRLRRLTFCRSFAAGDSQEEFPTDQYLLELSAKRARDRQGVLFGDLTTSCRKESNYGSHGIHTYKGKFYPQLVRALINTANLPARALVLDPFVGSGTTLVEASLLGYRSIGVDLNPLACLVAQAKTDILRVDARIFNRECARFEERLDDATRRWGLGVCSIEDTEPAGRRDFDPTPLVARAGARIRAESLVSWFPRPVLHKFACLLSVIDGTKWRPLRLLALACASDIARDCSQQEPRDLRIRRRREPISDAPVLTSFCRRFVEESNKVERCLELLRDRQFTPGETRVHMGDARPLSTIEDADLRKPRQVDLVLTSPPYATALPYLDTDRLSLLLLGMADIDASRRVEQELVGSREVAVSALRELEGRLDSGGSGSMLPVRVQRFLRDLREENKRHEVGFRRERLPALLFKYFSDMQRVFTEIARVLKPRAPCFVIVGDNYTTLGSGERVRIPTGDFLRLLASSAGLQTEEAIPITVTTEDLMHVRNAITENQILVMARMRDG